MDQSLIASGAAYIYRRSGSQWSQEAYVKASNASASQFFGKSVDISVDNAVVGADGKNSFSNTITPGVFVTSDPFKPASGAVYVFRKLMGQWAQEAHIKASNSNSNHNFGSAVSLSGDSILVAAENESSSLATIISGGAVPPLTDSPEAGAVYVYRNNLRLFDPDI